MFNILSKQTLSTQEQAEWFAKFTKFVLYEKINARKEYISAIKAFYNSASKSCILRITLDKKYSLGNDGRPLYIMLDYRSKEMTHSGINFEKSISDNDKTVQWIQNNEVLVFYPDNVIMKRI